MCLYSLFHFQSKVNIFDPQELSAPFLVDVNGEKEQLFLNPIFTFPSDVALSTSEDAILVTDRHRLSMINLTSGLVSTVAGDKKEGENDGQVRMIISSFCESQTYRTLSKLCIK